jgi:hypothetical protein
VTRDTSFARSFDPCASILTTHRGVSFGRWWGGRVGITDGQTRVSGSNHHWGRNDRMAHDSPRMALLVARIEGAIRKKRKEVEASVPARIESSGRCPHVVKQLQKSVGDIWSRIRSANALQKERSESGEQGPSASPSSSGETIGVGVARKG